MRVRVYDEHAGAPTTERIVGAFAIQLAVGTRAPTVSSRRRTRSAGLDTCRGRCESCRCRRAVSRVANRRSSGRTDRDRGAPRRSKSPTPCTQYVPPSFRRTAVRRRGRFARIRRGRGRPARPGRPGPCRPAQAQSWRGRLAPPAVPTVTVEPDVRGPARKSGKGSPAPQPAGGGPKTLLSSCRVYD